jgi:hypothetical protein
MTDLEVDLVEAKVNTMPACDFHDACQAQYDFKTSMGPWANGCQIAFDENGGRLGTGRGQKLVLNG